MAFSLPGLETLILNNIKSLPTTDTNTGEAIVAKNRGVHLLQRCPRLVRLEIDTGYDSLDQNTVDLVEIINHWPPSLKEFVLSDFGAPRPWFEALSGFLERMTVLSFYTCGNAKSWMFEKILCSCPLLVELEWPKFDVESLFCEEDAGRVTAVSAPRTKSTISAANLTGARMGPWVCIGLRKLAIMQFIWSFSPLRNRAAMKHLGLLKNLRSLHVNIMDCEVTNAPAMRKFFRDYYWPKGFYKYSVEDLLSMPKIRWMRKTWPLLEHVDRIRYD